MAPTMIDKNFGEYIFDFSSPFDPEQGTFLIASPFLRDPNFKHSVVLLTHHDETGTVGYVLNRPLKIPSLEIWEGVDLFGTYLGYGGPVANDTLHIIHRRPDIIDAEEEIMPGVFWQGSFEKVLEGLKSGELKPNEVKLFLGYSGWAPGQLDFELEEFSWFVAPATVEQIFEWPAGSLWKNTLKALGKKYEIISNFPEYPSLN